jgi:hypothetical protein
MVNTVERFNSRRKHEMMDGNTYSISNYRECVLTSILAINIHVSYRAENILKVWDEMNKTSQAIYDSLPASMQPAYFELVHHRIIASATVQHLWTAVGRSNAYAGQSRLSANYNADLASRMFNQDRAIAQRYHSLLGGKWTQ